MWLFSDINIAPGFNRGGAQRRSVIDREAASDWICPAQKGVGDAHTRSDAGQELRPPRPPVQLYLGLTCYLQRIPFL